MVEMPAIGKRVRMTVVGPAGSTSHEGVVLPGAAQDHITIKLANGYNVSYPFDMVKTIEEIGDTSSSESSMLTVLAVYCLSVIFPFSSAM